ncbi:MAG: hypothetical protein ABI305_03170 [Tepidiformaceae bacterium]
MKRAILLGLGAIGAVSVAVPALAQGVPPPPPSTFYGTVPAGVTAGQGVIAIVTNGGTQTACGAGSVLTDPVSSSTVYVVDVVADAQRAGCGKAGATVSFYFTPTAGSSGRLGTDSFAWGGPGPLAHNITNIGPSLTNRLIAPHVASDGVY